MSSLRALGSLFSRRFRPPRVIPRAQAQASALSLGILSHATIAGATAASAGLVGLLLFKKDTVESADDASTEESREKEPVKNNDGAMDDAAIRSMFTDKDGKMNWVDYIDYLTFGRTFEKNKANTEEDGDFWKDDEEAEEAEDEAAMKARFEEWMKEYGKTYRSKEETTMRCKRFKKAAKSVDKHNASKSSYVAATNDFADMTSSGRTTLMN